MRIATITLAILTATMGVAQGQVYDSPQAARADRDFVLQGEYTDTTRGMQVIAQGDGQFQVKIYKEGLPGMGWDRSAVQTIDADAQTVEDLVANFERVVRKSPTLGAKPPAGAVVLFDGTRQSLENHWQEGAKITDDGLLMQGCTSKDTFGDYTIHLEFRVPFMPLARGQARGNSGLYHQGRYETQILDSFGLEGKSNETGGIYEIRDPDLNMCLPPLVWQTYDVDYTAARYGDDGAKISDAVMTVRLNGTVVQRDVAVPSATRAAPLPEGPQDGPIYLQDHGNPVRFRNIWVKPRDIAAESRRPIVPGFERFHDSLGDVESGRTLLGELNCVACHRADQRLVERIAPKQSPILDGVGTRLKPEWMVKYIASPRSVKPGTTMPDLMSGMSPSRRQEAAIALTNFLIAGDSVNLGGKPGDTANGERLFHESGCVACHLPRNGTKVNPATSVPLVGLEDKYSRASLHEFLKDPLAVRPSGRMPQINLGDSGWTDVAQYLTGDSSLVFGNAHDRPEHPNMKFAAYHGEWQEMPDFDALTAAHEGVSRGLDISVGGRSDHFGIRFEGFLPIETAGKYSFRLGSDDGSILTIDDKRVIDNDGVHAPQSKEATLQLAAGWHAIRVEWFESSGGEELALDWAGPGIESGRIDKAIRLSPDETVVESAPEPVDPSIFVFDSSKVETGRQLFQSLGCAACHLRHENGAPLVATMATPALAECDPQGGCLAETNRPAVPDYELVDTQIAALAAALRAGVPSGEPTAAEQIRSTMTSLNCFACHTRDGMGGPETDRNSLWVSSIPEMGDEGRVPPPLDGVGDKLRAEWIEHVLSNGDKSRAYMKTYMPRFGRPNAGHLAAAFAALDSRTDAETIELDEPEHRIIATGRVMVGSKGLGCVSCHTFGPFKTGGIQAIALDTMASRIREDWFHRYLRNPQKYRPGTRMPTGFPDGRSTVRDICDGDPGRQLTAMWAFLEQGTAGGVPEGIQNGMIELKPETQPIIYRNFIEGVTPRGIAVGYPENVNLCWDANRMSLALIWQDRFIDASKHWNDRGAGNQVPLGGSLMNFEGTVPVAILADDQAPWPIEPPRKLGYRFLGYRLDDAGRPTFRYRQGSFAVEDTLEPVRGDLVGTLRREVVITPTEAQPAVGTEHGQLYFRAAAGNIQPLDDGWFLVDGAVRVRVKAAAAKPILRESGGHTEVVVPIQESGGTISQEIIW